MVLRELPHRWPAPRSHFSVGKHGINVRRDPLTVKLWSQKFEGLASTWWRL